MFLTVYILIKIILSNLICKSYINHCSSCNTKTNLWKKCEKPNVLIPDENGGCIGSKRCFLGKNYCFECEADGKLCKKCDPGYFPDENGGCSYANNCKISYNGECIECKEDFILIGKLYNLKICKSILSDDFLHCKEINNENGYCEKCEERFFLNNGDRKCTKVEKCNESIFALNVIEVIILIKKIIYVKFKKIIFYIVFKLLMAKNVIYMKMTPFFDENGNCSYSNYCSKSSNSYCHKYINGYYLSDNSYCSETYNCFSAEYDRGICLICNDNYYLDTRDYKCKSNLNNKNFQFCKKVQNNICINCEL